MTLFDWIVLAIFLSAAWLGMKRGFLSAALSLGTWVAGFFLAFALGDLVVSTLLSGWPAKIEAWLAGNPLAGAIFRGPTVAESIALWAARLGILVVVLVIGSTLTGLASRAVETVSPILHIGGGVRFNEERQSQVREVHPAYRHSSHR